VTVSAQAAQEIERVEQRSERPVPPTRGCPARRLSGGACRAVGEPMRAALASPSPAVGRP